MQITTEQLNAVAEILGTTDRNVVFSAVLRTLTVDGGFPVDAAFDALFGAGAFLRFAGDLHAALRA